MTLGVPLFVSAVSAIALSVALAVTPATATADSGDKAFNRLASFPVYLNTDVDTETVAEIVDVSKDGMTLVYTDSAGGTLGFVNITDPASPQPLGAIKMGGEPTSVAVFGDLALVAVNTSPSFLAPSGHLNVVDIASQTIVATHPLAGQPDSVAISPDGKYAAVVIENERDEDLGDGEPPQSPSGLLQIVDLAGEPGGWTLRDVELAGVADLFPEDAEPEYVDINRKNIAAVTLQENNHIALVDLATGTLMNDFSAGTVDLYQIDTLEEDPALISLTDAQSGRAREPDGVTWIGDELFATADEGDLFGGSRGITVFDTHGKVVYSSGNVLEHEVVRLGHYPDDRSENKGNETETVDFAAYGKDQYLFAASERSSVVFVYKVQRAGEKLKLVQTLPAGVRPEGIKAIPGRNLFVSASEKDARGDGFRSVLTIYRLEKGEPDYPTIRSVNRPDGTPIPWAALSGFATDPHDDDRLFTIHDSFYQQSRIYAVDIDETPAVITGEVVLKDSAGALAAVPFGAAMVNGDQTVNLDPEGIAVSASNDGSFWLATEGAGSVDDTSRPVTSNSLLAQVAADGAITGVVGLPASVNARQRRFGFEGVASVLESGKEVLYVAFQRAWVGDPEPNNVDDGGKVRIGRYDMSTGDWTFAYYPLDVRESSNKGWVGLSEITALGGGTFAVVERDNQANTDARIKKVYKISVDNVAFVADADMASAGVFAKEMVRDLMPDLQAANGMVLEKIESLAVTGDGDMLFANDNDGVDDSNGETQLIRVRHVFGKRHDHEEHHD